MRQKQKRKILCRKIYIYIYIFISKLIETKTNSRYLIGYINKVIIPLVFIFPKISGYVKTFQVKDENNKLMSFRINNEKPLEKYKTLWTNIEDLKYSELIRSLVYGDR